MSTDTFNVKNRIETTSDDGQTYFPLMQSGTIALWPADAIPDGWLECDGSTFLNTDYPDLANAIGNRFGAISGSLYRLPDFRGRVAVGHGSGIGLSARISGEWDGSEQISLTNDHVSHIHPMPHGHSLSPHTHSHSGHSAGVHFTPHTHVLSSAPHTISPVSGFHSHRFSQTFGIGPGTIGSIFPGPTSSSTPNGQHGHGTSGTGVLVALGLSITTSESNDSTGTSSPSNTGSPSSGSTPSYTGANTSIVVVQDSFVLKYIIKV
jgi:microcystin-dependent protein